LGTGHTYLAHARTQGWTDADPNEMGPCIKMVKPHSRVHVAGSCIRVLGRAGSNTRDEFGPQQGPAPRTDGRHTHSSHRSRPQNRGALRPYSLKVVTRSTVERVVTRSLQLQLAVAPLQTGHLGEVGDRISIRVRARLHHAHDMQAPPLHRIKHSHPATTTPRPPLGLAWHLACPRAVLHKVHLACSTQHEGGITPAPSAALSSVACDAPTGKHAACMQGADLGYLFSRRSGC
jgi:hypothetical protein